MGPVQGAVGGGGPDPAAAASAATGDESTLSRRCRIFAALLTVASALAVLPMGGLGLAGSLHEHTSRSQQEMVFWGYAAFALSILVIVAGGFVFAGLSGGSPRRKVRACVASAIAVLSMLWLVNQGLAWHAEAGARGGDWAGLDTIVAMGFGVVYPAFVGLLCVGQFLALLCIRPSGPA